MNNPQTKGLLHKILVANIVLGLAIFAGAVYFTITGEYVNLETRLHREALLNALSIGGLIYSVIAWYLDLYFHPHFSPAEG